MFADLNPDRGGAQTSLFETNDYSQNSIWFNIVDRIPLLRAVLGFFARGVQLNFGGLTHRGRSTYNLESLGLIYCVFWMVLIGADLQLLQPVIRNDVARVGTDQTNVAADYLLNPTIADFNEHTNLSIRLETIGERDWQKLSCQELQGIFQTQAEEIPMVCHQEREGHHNVTFTMPTNGDLPQHGNLKLFSQQADDWYEQKFTI